MRIHKSTLGLLTLMTASACIYGGRTATLHLHVVDPQGAYLTSVIERAPGAKEPLPVMCIEPRAGDGCVTWQSFVIDGESILLISADGYLDQELPIDIPDSQTGEYTIVMQPR